MGRPKVVITDCDYPPSTFEDQELSVVGAEIVRAQCSTPAQVLEVACDADGLIVEYAPVSREVIESMDRCKVIARYGIGYDSVDVKAATEKGIWVTNVPIYCLDEVADHTMGLLLALSRKLTRLDRATRRGVWNVWSTAQPVYPLRGATLGLIGLGNIARLVAERARGFGLRVIAHDPWVDAATYESLGIAPVSFEELLERSDFVSMHVPLVEATRNLIGHDQLRRMKPTAYLINTSRGRIVDEEALYNALMDGQIAGAALDVLAKEPPDPAYKLLGLENMIVTPHAAFYSEFSIETLRRHVARQVARVLQGLAPETPVNKI